MSREPEEHDKSMFAKSGSGITIGDQTLEEYLDEEKAKEDGKVVNTPDPVSLRHRIHIRYKDKKQPDGTGKLWTRKEIRMENWEQELGKAKTVDTGVSIILLRGEEVTGREIKELMTLYTKFDSDDRRVEARLSHLINKTDYGKLVERRREGKGLAYRLVPAALDLTPSELIAFVYAKETPKRELIAKYKGLQAYFGPDQPDPGQDAQSQGSPENRDLMPPAPPELLDVTTTIKTALQDALGVNVNVSGRIEIAFKFGD